MEGQNGESDSEQSGAKAAKPRSEHDRTKKQRHERFGVQENDYQASGNYRYGNRQNRARITQNRGSP
jgi:hypothetical protein